jgi:hydrogenase maturation protease
MPRTYVLGLGNTLMGDDGFGPAVIREFDDKYECDEHVEIVDLGTPGLDLTPWFADTPHIIIVDTVNAALPPGWIRVYEKRSLMVRAILPRVSPHDPGVKETLATLELAGRAPKDVIVIGAVPDKVGLSLELSETVQRAVPHAVQAIVEALARFGHKVHSKTDTAPEAIVMADFAQALSA